MTNVLSLAQPDVFGRMTQYRQQVIECAGVLGLAVDWQLETIAMCSLIGTVSIQDALVKKALSGAAMTADEAKQFNRHAQIGAEILEKIPRMEGVANAIRYQLKNYDGSGDPARCGEGRFDSHRVTVTEGGL